jgi:hypothetical protein
MGVLITSHPCTTATVTFMFTAIAVAMVINYNIGVYQVPYVGYTLFFAWCMTFLRALDVRMRESTNIILKQEERNWSKRATNTSGPLLDG